MNRNAPKAKAQPRAAPAGGTALATYDAQLAIEQKKAEIEKHRGPREVTEYTGPRIKWEDTGLYKAMVKSSEIEEELTKIRNLIRKRTDPMYEPDDEDFNVAPVKKFNVKVDYYKLLDIDDFATAKDIKGAYKKMALQYHPDKNRDKKADELAKMQEEFEKVQEAYEVLSDRATRRQYDRAKFDEARAKSQGMNSSMYSQKTDTDGNFWGRWTGKKEKKTMSMDELRELSKSQKVPKSPDMKVEVMISLDKALRGGMKIREVKRDRMQRSFGAAQPSSQVFHVMIEPGQADGSEFRLDSDGHWTSVAALPGDLVFVFKHKAHSYLRQVQPAQEGNLEVSMPLRVRAKAMDHVLSAWSPTFKGQMLLLRFLNPLLEFAPSKGCSVTFWVEHEGLPLHEDKTRRGALRVTVNVQLEGDALVPPLQADCCKETLFKRYNRSFNHQPHLKVDLTRTARASGPSVRHYRGSTARERGGRVVQLPAIVTVWEAPPETDPLLFAKAASTLAFQARKSPVSFAWGYHPGLGRRPLPRPRHFKLGDEEIASDEEEEGEGVALAAQSAGPPQPGAALPASKDAFDFDMLEESLPGEAEAGRQPEAAPPRRKKPRPEKEEFLLQFNLGPLDGFPEPESEEEDVGGVAPRGGASLDLSGSWIMMNLTSGQRVTCELSHAPGSSLFTGVQDGHEMMREGRIQGGSISWKVGDCTCWGRLENGGQRIMDIEVRIHDTVLEGKFTGVRAAPQAQKPQAPKARKRTKQGEVQVELDEQEQEGEEEQELTRLIRLKQNEMEQAKRKWKNKKERIQGEREEEESTLKELLEKDKAREYERIEKEMNGLRSNFEFQITAEKRWMEEFLREVPYHNEWVCVFKPSMVARKKPAEESPVSRRIMFDEVVKAKDKPSDDYWVQLEGSGDWCLIWHQKHGKLLQKWFGKDQKRFLDLDKKVEERRQTRNKTFLEYKRKKREVSEWTIPPGPTEEERCEIADEEAEHLHNLLEPILKDLKEHKRRLRDLRQKRLQAASERAQKASGSASLASGQLPAGFRLEEDPAPAMASKDQTLSPSAGGAQPQPSAEGWEAKKQAGDKAFKEKDWNTALSSYSQALEQGGGDLDSMQCATLLSNRALVHGKLFDWQKSLEDATDATIHETEWPKGWLRRATAELRLYKNKEALSSLMRGMSFAGKVAGQFLPLITECEAALYSDRDMAGNADGDPGTAVERIAKFRDEGSRAFEQGKQGTAVLFYTRALYHRSMMEGRDEAIVLSNRSAAFLKLELPNEALADSLASSEKDAGWAKPLVRAGQASLLLDDFKSAYQYFARARRLEDFNQTASNGVNDCLQRIIKWEYTAAMKRWSRFTMDRQRSREGIRIWALSDVFFDQIGVPEWCKSLSSSFFRDDVLMLAGNLADSLEKLRFALTVLKSKFRRVFFVPGNHDMWVRRATLQTMIKGEKVKNEEKEMVDSVSKLLEVLKVCDDLGVETAPAEVAGGVFVTPMFSWYSRDFISREKRKQFASETDTDTKVTIDQWIKWPFPGGSDDAWKFFMRMNEASLRTTLVAKSAFERFSSVQAQVLTMTHFLTHPDLPIDWTVPGIWDYIGCDGLDEQIRAIGSDVHVYGRACTGAQSTAIEGVHYVHNYVGSTEKHRPNMAPFCVYNRGELVPSVQPSQQDTGGR